MSWLRRFVGQESDDQAPEENQVQAIEEQMSPGLTGNYDWELREKAGVHIPPPPPEFMGLEGEYDPQGLVKRVAVAFDQDSQIDDIETLEISQEGSTIVLKGQVPDQLLLDRAVDVARKVDGTKSVDSSQVMVESTTE